MKEFIACFIAGIKPTLIMLAALSLIGFISLINIHLVLIPLLILFTAQAGSIRKEMAREENYKEEE